MAFREPDGNNISRLPLKPDTGATAGGRSKGPTHGRDDGAGCDGPDFTGGGKGYSGMANGGSHPSVRVGSDGTDVTGTRPEG